MIYLIGGAPRVGKSIIAKQLMTEKNIPWLSTDVLRSVLYDVTPETLQKKLFPYGGASDNDVVFAEPIKVIIDQHVTEAHSMAVGLERFIKHQLDAHDDFILEGVHLLPEIVADFYKKYPDLQGQIKIIFILDTDKENILRGLQINTSHFDWLSGAKTQTYQKIAEFTAEFSKYIGMEADKYGIMKFVRTDNFNRDVKQCLDLLL